MTNGDGLGRFTRSKTKRDKRVREEFERQYKEGMEGGPPRKKKSDSIYL